MLKTRGMRALKIAILPFLLVFLVTLPGCKGSCSPEPEAPQQVEKTSPKSYLVKSLDNPGRCEYLLIGKRAFYESAIPLLEHREAEGMECAYLSVETIRGNAAELTPSMLREAALRILGRGGEVDSKPGYLVLAGDHDSVPAATFDFYMGKKTGTVNIATDLYAVMVDANDLDNSSVRPDTLHSVGRLPADTPEELAAMVGKIIAYEKNADYSPWRKRINFVSCPANLGKLIDMAIEETAKIFINNLIPPDMDVSMTYGNPDSFYCPWPPGFDNTAAERYNEGAFAWVYMGHGWVDSLSRVNYEGRAYGIMNKESASKLDAGDNRAIMLFLCCLAGRYQDEEADSLAEALLKSPGGPAAVYAASAESDPYGNAVTGKEAITAFFELGLDRLGDVFRETRRLTLDDNDDLRTGLDATARTLLLDIPLEDDAHAHVLMYNLFGDPAMKIRQPEKDFNCQVIKIGPKNRTEKLLVRAVIPELKGGKAIVTLEVPRSRFKAKPVFLEKSEIVREFKTNYEMVNDKVLFRVETDVKDGAFQAEFEKLDGLEGRHVIKVYAWNDSGAWSKSYDMEF